MLKVRLTPFEERELASGGAMPKFFQGSQIIYLM